MKQVFFPSEIKGENVFSDSISSYHIQYFSLILLILPILVITLEIFSTKENSHIYLLIFQYFLFHNSIPTSTMCLAVYLTIDTIGSEVCLLETPTLINVL